jgi:two-component system LytT family response regulator
MLTGKKAERGLWWTYLQNFQIEINFTLNFMKLKTIVVEDERPSRDALTSYLKEFCSNVEIQAECDSIGSAAIAIRKYQPQLIFLDVELPDSNGFELLRQFNPMNFKVIFVTAFSEYALQAFRYSATDYLLKPIKIDELVEAVNKVKHEIQFAAGNQNLEVLIENVFSRNEQPKQIVIPDRNGFQVIQLDVIVYCKADGYCTHFYLQGNKKLISSRNLKYYEDLLYGNGFMRVHHSYLINPAQVIGYSHQGEIRLKEDHVCPLGNGYKQAFMQHYQRFK